MNPSASAVNLFQTSISLKPHTGLVVWLSLSFEGSSARLTVVIKILGERNDKSMVRKELKIEIFLRPLRLADG